MATDARGHTIPAGSDVFDPQGSDVALSASVNDIIVATNATDRASKVAALAPTTTRPAFVWQVDTGVLTCENGTTSVVVSPPEVVGSGSLTGTTTETAVPGCSLSLTAGTWDIEAKCYADWSVSGAGPRYTLRLRKSSPTGTLLDESQVYIGAALVGSVPMSVSAYRVVLGAADTVMLTVLVTGPSSGITNVQQADIHAVRVA